LLHEEAPIKARCQDCAEKSQCDICGQWSKKIGCLTISGGRFYKTLNFCDKVCRKEAKKQAQELIWRYNMAQRGLNP
jgi:hypothetical protein